MSCITSYPCSNSQVGNTLPSSFLGSTYTRKVDAVYYSDHEKILHITLHMVNKTLTSMPLCTCLHVHSPSGFSALDILVFGL